MHGNPVYLGPALTFALVNLVLPRALADPGPGPGHPAVRHHGFRPTAPAIFSRVGAVIESCRHS